MPQEIKKHQTILDAIKQVDILAELIEKHDGHFKFELDLEVIAYGRNYNGKKVGPYLRLFEYGADEQIIKQGEWGGNTFYITVDGQLDVYVADDEQLRRGERGNKIGSIPPGQSFGEMAILAGVQRNATVVVPPGGKATVFEVTRPALRLLRKLDTFGKKLDQTYRKHGLGRTLEEVRQAAKGVLSDDLVAQLGDAARFVVYGKNHVLHREGDPINRLVFIKNGWVRRVRGMEFSGQVGDVALGADESIALDFLGGGNCLGLEGLKDDREWAYTATVLARTEVLEISLPHLRANPKLRDAILRSFPEFSIADDDVSLARTTDPATVVATEKEISTGLVDGTNLLVMDMDLCVRCGNCSLACHTMHGQSRLLRRGIHIERPVRPGASSTQHVLSPSVCMHCQDPECLTGCPTGAIGRFSNGQIDIDPKTCIGCSDCATQCPYNAITMVPRKPPAPEPLTFVQRARAWFDIKPPTPPPAVEEVDNNVAVKCNLCNNTPLNPAGAKTHAYSCQENCPTGALVRVNPREYFTEVQQKLGTVFRSQTQPIGRNIHKRDPVMAIWHFLGWALILGLTAATIIGIARYGLDGRLGGTWLTIRWLTGFVGLGGIAVVMAYPGRKQVYRRRTGALRYWLQAHVYLGVVAGILLLLHGGTNTGGLLTSLLMIAFDLVIVSGLFGIACYLIVPRIMTSIEGEPLLIEDLRARREELREQLGEIGQRCGDQVRDIIKRRVRPRYLSLEYLLRQYIRREELSALEAEARREMHEEIERLPDPASQRYLIDAVEATVTLRRVDSLIYLHQLLKLWLAPHVVATALMLVLMFVHIVQVTFFAVR
jgi:Fe-S-cluster-containing dehydrogenase component